MSRTSGVTAHDEGTRGGPGVLAIAFLGWLVLLGSWAVATPRLAAPDEPAHVVWAAAAARGTWTPPSTVQVEPSGFRSTVSQVELPAAYGALSAVPACHAGRPEVAADCAPALPAEPGERATVTTTAGTYLPVWYAVVGLPSLVLDPPQAVTGMRLVNALLVAGLLTAALASLRRQQAGRATTAGFLVAVTPVGLHMASTVNPSGVEIAGAVALLVVSLELLWRRGEVPRSAAASLAAAGVAVALARPLGIVWAVGVPLVAVVAAGRSDQLGRLRDDPRVRGAIGAIGAAVVLAVAWLVVRDTLSAFSGTPAPETSAADVLRSSLARTNDRMAQMVSVLGWADVVLPRLLVAAWIGLPVVAAGAALVAGRRRPAAVALLVAAMVLVLPLAADLRSAGVTGYAWQGRYQLPLAIAVPLLAGHALDPVVPRPRWGLAAVATAWLAGMVVALGTLLGRYEIGAPAGWGDVLTAGRWEPPLADGLLGAAAVAGGAVLVTLAARRVATGRPDDRAAARSPRPAS